ncbi:TPA: ead/Ea22-like family protein [Escherichia coli]|nr:ead/Ea22-like family protein [Escherichia coli]
MSKIDYQALREAAQNAKDLGGIKNYKRGEQAVAEFESLITPHIVLALLDERERNQQYIKRRDQENEEIALTVGKLRVELEAAENNLIDSECHVAELEEALRDKQALLEVSEKRIAELEDEPVSQAYKLNALDGNYPVTPDGWISCSERMPEETGDIIVVSDGIVMSGISYSRRDGFYIAALEYDDDEPIGGVTHWMPLPEPPQEVK